MGKQHATLQRRSRTQTQRKHHRPTDDTLLIQQQKDNSLQLQRAINNPTPETLTPEVVEQLQATHGNQFVTRLIQQSQSDQSTPIQRWQTATPTTSSGPSFGTIKSDEIGAIKKLKGLKKAKKSAKKPQKLVEQIQAGDQTQTREQTPSEHGSIISENANVIGTAMSSGNFESALEGLQNLTSILGQYVGLIKTVVKFLMGIKKTIKNFKTRKALQKVIKSLKPKVDDGSASSNDTKTYDSATYGYKKVHRRFITGIATTVIALGKAISTWVTFFTGGTTAVFTGIVDLLTSSANSVIKGYHAVKAIYKERKGTKGVARAQNAQSIIESAFDNQPDALQLLIKLKVGKSVFAELKEQGKVSGKYPKTTTEMTLFLRKLSKPEFNALRKDLKKQLSSVK